MALPPITHLSITTAPDPVGLIAHAATLPGLFSDRSSRSLPRLFDRFSPRHLSFSPCLALATASFLSVARSPNLWLLILTEKKKITVLFLIGSALADFSAPATQR